jgi:hypothetical protein
VLIFNDHRLQQQDDLSRTDIHFRTLNLPDQFLLDIDFQLNKYNVAVQIDQQSHIKFSIFQ